MSSTFKDNFSKQAELYARYRPLYPEQLYNYLSSLCSQHKLAWDCGTGNGQAALGIARHFEKVIATDPSEQQIKMARSCNNVSYSVSRAENSPLDTGSADLITVANALHWFDFDAFYREAQRVLKPGGILAAWSYANPSHSPEFDKVTDRYHDEIIGGYWLPESWLVIKKYTTLPFPYTPIVSPEFKIEKQLAFDDLVGLFNTWSATQRYKDEHGKDPVKLIERELAEAWGDKTHKKIFTWDLALKIGRK